MSNTTTTDQTEVIAQVTALQAGAEAHHQSYIRILREAQDLIDDEAARLAMFRPGEVVRVAWDEQIERHVIKSAHGRQMWADKEIRLDFYRTVRILKNGKYGADDVIHSWDLDKMTSTGEYRADIFAGTTVEVTQ